MTFTAPSPWWLPALLTVAYVLVFAAGVVTAWYRQQRRRLARYWTSRLSDDVIDLPAARLYELDDFHRLAAWTHSWDVRDAITRVDTVPERTPDPPNWPPLRVRLKDVDPAYRNAIQARLDAGEYVTPSLLAYLGLNHPTDPT